MTVVPVNSTINQDGEISSFLNDMAAGISKRASEAEKDVFNLSHEEQIRYYTQLVEFELDIISQYEFITFEDEKFNDFAHGYIDACSMQLMACKYSKSINFFNAIWDSAAYIRSAIITELYNNYDLPITAEIAHHYSDTPSSSAVDIGIEDLLPGIDFMDTYTPETTDKVVEIIENSRPRLEGNYWRTKFKLKNISSHDISTITLNLNFLDKNGDILSTTHPQKGSTLKPGQSIFIECLTSIDEGAVAVQPYSYSCHVLNDGSEEFFCKDIDGTPVPLK